MLTEYTLIMVLVVLESRLKGDGLENGLIMFMLNLLFSVRIHLVPFSVVVC